MHAHNDQQTPEPKPRTETEQALLDSLADPHNKELRKRAMALVTADPSGKYEQMTEEERFEDFCANYRRVPEEKREAFLLWISLVADDLCEEDESEED